MMPKPLLVRPNLLPVRPGPGPVGNSAEFPEGFTCHFTDSVRLPDHRCCSPRRRITNASWIRFLQGPVAGRGRGVNACG